MYPWIDFWSVKFKFLWAQLLLRIFKIRSGRSFCIPILPPVCFFIFKLRYQNIAEQTSRKKRMSPLLQKLTFVWSLYSSISRTSCVSCLYTCLCNVLFFLRESSVPHSLRSLGSVTLKIRISLYCRQFLLNFSSTFVVAASLEKNSREESYSRGW